MAPVHAAKTRLRPTIVAAILVCIAATLPYVSTIDNYFVRDDFGVVQLLASKPANYFPKWFYTTWMDFIWGYTPDEIRPFPALSYQLTALPGATSVTAHHVFNIALHAANGLLVLLMASGVARLSLPAATFSAIVFVLLPVHPESVAWITGRVDSMPAFLYAATFLLYARWRRSERSSPLYVASLVVFFLALFTKQTTITMLATLAAFDLLLGPRPYGSVWKRVQAYVPFAAMTAGYLGLRVLLFGEVAREDSLTREQVFGFFQLVDRHLANVVVGDPDGSRALVWLAIVLVVSLCFASPADRRSGFTLRALLFFGPVWWVIGVAPILVAGYESPRHVYLAAMGWPVLLGLALDSVWRLFPAIRWRRIAGAAAAGVVVAYAILVADVVGEWNRMAAVSRQAVHNVARTSSAFSPGTLIIVGAPPRSWGWALPFALKPPYTYPDVTQRSYVISPQSLHCCTQQWPDDTHRALAAWAAGPAPESVVALRWDPDTGALSKLTSDDNESLPHIARILMGTTRPQALDMAIRRLIDSIGPSR